MAETKMQLADWLDDLCVRFIINLPQEELESVERICFQVEEAQWFYEDFVRPLDPSLPSLSLKTFCMAIFRICPLLSSFSPEHHLAAYSQFLAYKTRVPVRGAILLNEKMDQVLLVKGWKKGASWSFPRGKINKDETDLDCAIREVGEETGYDLATSGLVPTEESFKSIEVTMREQHMKLYIFRDVPMNTSFQARTRKEISKIAWWKLSSLPGYHRKKKQNLSQTQEQDESGDSLKANKIYMVAPFLPQLRKWIAQQRKQHSHKRTTSEAYISTGDAQVTDGDIIAEDDMLSDLPPQSVAPMAYDISTALPQMVSNSSGGNAPHAVNMDPATHMKRMLGVSDSVNDNTHQTGPASGLPQKQQDLLSLLQRNRPPDNPPDRSALFAVTPLNQIESNAAEPRSPRHHQLRPLPSSSMAPPPNFPFSPAQVQHTHGLSENISHPQSVGMPPSVPPTTSALPPNIFRTQQFPPANLTPAQVHPIVKHQEPARTKNIIGQTEPPILQVRGTDPPQPPPQQRQQDPVAPPPSQLPQPKLNNQAMNLLNMFKANSSSFIRPLKSSLPKVETALPQNADTAQGNSTKSIATSSSIEATHSQQNSLGSRAAFAGLIPSTLSPTAIGGANKAPMPSATADKRNKNQEALLGLFAGQTDTQKPNQSSMPQKSEFRSTASQGANTPSNTLLSLLKAEAPNTPLAREEHVDIAKSSAGNLPKQAPLDSLSQSRQHGVAAKASSPIAGSNEAISSQPPPISDHGQRPPKSRTQNKQTQKQPEGSPPTVIPKILQRPSKGTSTTPGTKSNSASVTTKSEDTPKSQDTERTPTRRRNKQPKTALQKAEKKLATQAAPMQILKRPSNSEAHTHDTGMEGPSPPEKATSAKGPPNKPFTPQILRRPKQDSVSLAKTPAQPPETDDNHLSSNTEQQQKALLSLLSGTKQGPPPPSFGPARQYSAGNVQDKSSSSVPQSPGLQIELSRSRINSIASPPSGTSPPRSRTDSTASVPRAGTPLRSGRDSARSQTPISPADKGFLVNYLEGVIGKGGAK